MFFTDVVKTATGLMEELREQAQQETVDMCLSLCVCAFQYREIDTGRGMMMALAGLMNTAERKCLWFKDTLGKLNKERWHRGGEHERKLHNQLSHKLGENILALLAECTVCRYIFTLTSSNGQ